MCVTELLAPNGPEREQHKMCMIRATLYHIGGQTSQIQMSMPIYSRWGEFLEDGENAMREYVNQLTRHWVGITGFDVDSGSIDPNGEIVSMFLPKHYDIPLDRVFAPGKRGEWVSPEMHPHHPRNNQRGSSKGFAELAKIVSDRNDAVYHKVDETTTLCGVPVSSRQHYFIDGDLPSGEFTIDGIDYLVIYKVVKSSLKGGQECA